MSAREIPDALERIAEMPEAERRILAAVASGLLFGLREYGPINPATDRRNFGTELRAELRDGFVYAVAAEEQIDALRARVAVLEKAVAQHLRHTSPQSLQALVLALGVDVAQRLALAEVSP